MDELKGITIPPKPQLLLDIDDANGKLGLVADIISTDASVSAAVLRTVNSPFYRRMAPITSIHKAVIMLGEQTVSQLVQGLLLKTSLRGPLPQAWFEWYWNDSSTTALLTASLCHTLMLPIEDIAYCVGLFHNCGAPIMAQRFPDYIQTLPELWQHTTTSLTEKEEARYGVNHATVSGMVARYWKLPKSLTDAVTFHHQPINDKLTALLDHETLTLLCVLQWGNFLSREYFTSGRLQHSPEWHVQGRAVVEYLDINDSDWFDISQESLSDLYDQHIYEKSAAPDFIENIDWLTLPGAGADSDAHQTGAA